MPLPRTRKLRKPGSKWSLKGWALHPEFVNAVGAGWLLWSSSLTNIEKSKGPRQQQSFGPMKGLVPEPLLIVIHTPMVMGKLRLNLTYMLRRAQLWLKNWLG